MRIVGLDLGRKSLGIAISDESAIIASPVENFRFAENNFQAAIKRLQEVCEKYENVGKIVLGFPKNMDNSIGPRAQMCLKFKDLIQKNLGIEVFMLDERLTTKMSHSLMIGAGMRRNKRKSIKDQTSAVIILQDFLKGHSG